MNMPIYLQLLFAITMIVVIFSEIGRLLISVSVRKRRSKKHGYLLAKETLDNGVGLYTLEFYRHGFLFFPGSGVMLMMRTFEQEEAEKWAKMLNIEIEDLDTE